MSGFPQRIGILDLLQFRIIDSELVIRLARVGSNGGLIGLKRLFYLIATCLLELICRLVYIFMSGNRTSLNVMAICHNMLAFSMILNVIGFTL